MAFKWYASEGAEFLKCYGGVSFDVDADAEHNPEYAILWDVARHVSQQRSYGLKLIAVFATMSTRMKDVFMVVIIPESL